MCLFTYNVCRVNEVSHMVVILAASSYMSTYVRMYMCVYILYYGLFMYVHTVHKWYVPVKCVCVCVSVCV